MTQAQEIINTLNGLGVNIHAQGDKLVIVPKSKVPSDLVAELHQHKADPKPACHQLAHRTLLIKYG